MKFTKIFRILTVASLISLLATTVPTTPVLAAGDLTIVPRSGEIGDEFELYGSGFTPTQEYALYLSRERASPNEEMGDDVKASLASLEGIPIDIEPVFAIEGK